jgi:hypothetical protein
MYLYTCLLAMGASMSSIQGFARLNESSLFSFQFIGSVSYCGYEWTVDTTGIDVTCHGLLDTCDKYIRMGWNLS